VERAALSKDLKMLLNAEPNIFTDHQNNYVEEFKRWQYCKQF